MNKELQKEYDAMGFPLTVDFEYDYILNKDKMVICHTDFDRRAEAALLVEYANVYHANQQTIADLKANHRKGTETAIRIHAGLTAEVESLRDAMKDNADELENDPTARTCRNVAFQLTKALEEKGTV